MAKICTFCGKKAVITHTAVMTAATDINYRYCVKCGRIQ